MGKSSQAGDHVHHDSIMLEGRIAVVTGCSRTTGIGHACCLALLRRGAFVIGVDLSPLAAISPLAIDDPTLPEAEKALRARFRFIQTSITDATLLAEEIAICL